MNHFRPTTIAASLFAAVLLLPVPAMAHCDGVDGPVVTKAKQSLEHGNVDLVLPWVRAEDEPVIRQVFSHASAVRKLGPEARQLADTYFFETVVRVHRAAEGEPYTGLKPAGRDLGKAIPAADEALAKGSPAALEKMLVDSVRNGLHEKYQNALGQARYKADDVAAGRRFVQAYVPYVHYVEQLWDAAQSAHGRETATAPHAH